jgi:hypothetical protein
MTGQCVGDGPVEYFVSASAGGALAYECCRCGAAFAEDELDDDLVFGHEREVVDVAA